MMSFIIPRKKKVFLRISCNAKDFLVCLFLSSSETEAKPPGDVSARLCLPQALEATYFGAGLRPPHILKYEMLEVKAVNAVQKLPWKRNLVEFILSFCIYSVPVHWAISISFRNPAEENSIYWLPCLKWEPARIHPIQVTAPEKVARSFRPMAKICSSIVEGLVVLIPRSSSIQGHWTLSDFSEKPEKLYMLNQQNLRKSSVFRDFETETMSTQLHGE